MVSTTFISMTERKKKEELERISYIWYSVNFKDQTEALLDSESKVNVMSQAFALQLGFKTRKTNFGAQKIDRITLETYEMVVSNFSVLDKDSRMKFFEKSFLLANVKLHLVFGMLFLTMSNTDINFKAWNL